MGVVKSQKSLKTDSGVGSRVKKSRFKGGIKALITGGEGKWQRTEH